MPEGDWEVMPTPVGPSLTERAKSARAAFIEDNRRLAKAYERLLQADRAYLWPDFGSTEDLQNELVDATHTYHRALYGNIGNFINFFRLAAPTDLTVIDGVAMPTRSARKWLAWIGERSDSFAAAVGPIELSRRFRAEYIDHPQGQNRSYSWNTIGAEHPRWGWMTAIYYFSHPTGEYPVFAPDYEQLDPFAPGWTPFIGHEAFMLAPDYHVVQYAWETLITALLVTIRRHALFSSLPPSTEDMGQT